MNTDRELMQQALEALEVRCGTHADERKPGGVIEALRTAIQQAEAKTDEPVAKNGHMVMVDSGALQMVRNALRRDAGNGMRIRAEMLAALDAATHPAPGVPDGWSDRHTRVAAFALRLFADASWGRSDEAAQKNYMGNPSDYKAFQSDAKDAEEARAILLTAAQAQKGQP